MSLADGRRLSWQEFGSPDGRPVAYFHGGGSFSAEAGIYHREAVARNIRLIATNRPGVQESTPCPGRPVAAYSDDVAQLFDRLEIERFACAGESNGGLVTMAIAATMPSRVIGAIPINPTLPWFDPMARRVSSRNAVIAYRLMKYGRWLMIRATLAHSRKPRPPQREQRRRTGRFDPQDLVGPPPGTELDIGELVWRCLRHGSKTALEAELRWAADDWGFDYYSIPVPLDFFCGVHDVQAPFALVLSDTNKDARFHPFSFGHIGFAHPNARARIFDRLRGYFDAADSPQS